MTTIIRVYEDIIESFPKLFLLKGKHVNGKSKHIITNAFWPLSGLIANLMSQKDMINELINKKKLPITLNYLLWGAT